MDKKILFHNGYAFSQNVHEPHGDKFVHHNGEHCFVCK